MTTNPLFQGDPADYCPNDSTNLRAQTGDRGLRPCPVCGYDPTPRDAA